MTLEFWFPFPSDLLWDIVGHFPEIADWKRSHGELASRDSTQKMALYGVEVKMEVVERTGKFYENRMFYGSLFRQRTSVTKPVETGQTCKNPKTTQFSHSFERNDRFSMGKAKTGCKSDGNWFELEAVLCFNLCVLLPFLALFSVKRGFLLIERLFSFEMFSFNMFVRF